MSTTVTTAESGTNVTEIGDGIFRISTPVPPSAMPGGFTFNQFLIVDDEPLLFHTGLRKMFPLVSHAVARARTRRGCGRKRFAPRPCPS